MKPLLSKEEISELLAPLDPVPGTGSVDNSAELTPGNPARVRIECRCSEMVQQELLQLQKDSILMLKNFPEPLELFVDNQLVARGTFGQAEGNPALIITKTYPLPK